MIPKTRYRVRIQIIDPWGNLSSLEVTTDSWGVLEYALTSNGNREALGNAGLKKETLPALAENFETAADLADAIHPKIRHDSKTIYALEEIA